MSKDVLQKIRKILGNEKYPSYLGWAGSSFGEHDKRIRQVLQKIKKNLRNEKYPSYLGWAGSSFGEHDKRIGQLKESFYSKEDLKSKYENGEIDPVHANELKHEDPLTPEEEGAVFRHTSGNYMSEIPNDGGISDSTGKPLAKKHLKHDKLLGSYNINALLGGEHDRLDDDVVNSLSSKSTFDKVKKHIMILGNAIRPGRTNKKTVQFYTGIPYHIGEKLKNAGEGSTHVTDRFISASSNQDVARRFSEAYDRNPENIKSTYSLSIEAPPNSIMGVAHHSFFNAENEGIIPPGTHVTVNGHHIEKDRSGNDHHVIRVSLSPEKRIPIEDIVNQIKQPSSVKREVSHFMNLRHHGELTSSDLEAADKHGYLNDVMEPRHYEHMTSSNSPYSTLKEEDPKRYSELMNKIATLHSNGVNVGDAAIQNIANGTFHGNHIAHRTLFDHYVRTGEGEHLIRKIHENTNSPSLKSDIESHFGAEDKIKNGIKTTINPQTYKKESILSNDSLNMIRNDPQYLNKPGIGDELIKSKKYHQLFADAFVDGHHIPHHMIKAVAQANDPAIHQTLVSGDSKKLPSDVVTHIINNPGSTEAHKMLFKDHHSGAIKINPNDYETLKTNLARSVLKQQ